MSVRTRTLICRTTMCNLAIMCTLTIMCTWTRMCTKSVQMVRTLPCGATICTLAVQCRILVNGEPHGLADYTFVSFIGLTCGIGYGLLDTGAQLAVIGQPAFQQWQRALQEKGLNL
eukprot:983549-Amphidinium_carterae.2